MNTKDRKAGIGGDKVGKMKALYDHAPYPSSLNNEPPPLVPILEHWINGLYGFQEPVLYKGCRILVAGCGSGEEAISLAQHYSESEVIGVDFSTKSIAFAVEKARGLSLGNVDFFAEDLTDRKMSDRFELFDFILCHGVADYVGDVDAMLENFSCLLKEGGLIYLSVNTPYHPAGRLREAMSALEVPSHLFTDSEEERKKLKVSAKLMGAKIGGRSIGDASISYLNVDIFPPLAHHFSLDDWIARGSDHRLHFCASMQTLFGLLELDEGEFSLLFGLDRKALARWMIRLRQPAGMQLLFGKRCPLEIDFDQEEEVLNWKPRLAASIGKLPMMTMPADYPMHISLQFPGLPVFTIFSNAFDLEVLRLCDGSSTIRQIIASINASGNFLHLKSILYQAYHYGIISS